MEGRSEFFNALVTIIGLITTVAIVAVIVSRNAQTPAVIQSAASGFGNDLAVAVSPVTGSQVSINLGYPSSGTSGLAPLGSPFMSG